MKIDIAPHFPLPGFWSDRACAEVVYEFDGQRYHLRQLDKHILYRTADRDSLEHTLYVPCRAMPGTPNRPLSKTEKTWTPAVYPETVFMEQVRAGESGRLALYACPSARDCVAALFFTPDGTGKFMDYYTANRYSAHEAGQTLNFLWDGIKYDIAEFADVLTCDWETLLPLCEDVFTQQVWPRMKDPYVACDEFPDEPFMFDCGSREELEYITRCIFHANSLAFAGAVSAHSIPIVYHAHTSKHQGGFFETKQWSLSSPLDEAAKRLCRLAYTHNAFQGGTWKYSRYRENTRRKSYRFEPNELLVSVASPSAHERAEALLTLFDWLEGKVTERERRTLLGLEEASI